MNVDGVLVIPEELDLIESIILKYRNYEHLSDPGLLFTYNKRYPIEDKYNIGVTYANDTITQHPQLPIYAAELVKNYLYIIHPNDRYKNLFRHNPMLGNRCKNLLPFETVDECIKDMCLNITDEDLNYIGDILDNQIHNKFGSLEMPISNVLYINVDKEHLEITVGDDICTYRMIEAGYLK